ATIPPAIAPAIEWPSGHKPAKLIFALPNRIAPPSAPIASEAKYHGSLLMLRAGVACFSSPTRDIHHPSSPAITHADKSKMVWISTFSPARAPDWRFTPVFYSMKEVRCRDMRKEGLNEREGPPARASDSAGRQTISGHPDQAITLRRRRLCHPLALVHDAVELTGQRLRPGEGRIRSQRAGKH